MSSKSSRESKLSSPARRTVTGVFNWCDASAEYLVDLFNFSLVEMRAASASLRWARFCSESNASFSTGFEKRTATKWLATKPPNNSNPPAPPICQRSRCNCATALASGYRQIFHLPGRCHHRDVRDSRFAVSRAVELMPTALLRLCLSRRHLSNSAVAERRPCHPGNGKIVHEACWLLALKTALRLPSGRAIHLWRWGIGDRERYLQALREFAAFPTARGSARPVSHFAILAGCPGWKVRLEIFAEDLAQRWQ